LPVAAEACQRLRPGSLAVQHLTLKAAPGAPHDVDGQAFARLGVEQTTHYLIRPDGHVGTAPLGRTWTASNATSRTGFHTHTASSLSNAARASNIANTPTTEHRPGQQPPSRHNG
jgi:hypothetical protein